MSKKIIDISAWQGVIDWNAVKSQVDGAIIRCGYGGNVAAYDDVYFKRNADECTRLGIPFGVYLYSYATTVEQAKDEAAHALRLVKGYKLSYPIYYDLEENGTQGTAVARSKAFGDIIEQAGFWCGIYANEYWMNSVIGTSLTRFTLWCAKYSSYKPNIAAKYDAWQYTSSAYVNGIAGRVDMSEFYRDIPAEIAGKASASKTQETTQATAKPAEACPAGSTLSLVEATMQGKYGNGDTRKAKLGKRYDEVMNMINHIATASVSTLVSETKAGKYGNGDTRKTVLGNRYKAVQDAINGASYACEYYTIQSGDTLGAIASKYGTTVAHICEMNPIIQNPNLIIAGWRIRVK